MKSAKPKLVRVEWYDAANNSRWEDAEEARDREPPLIVSAGYLLKKSPKYVTIATSHDFDCPQSRAEVMGALVIPRGCVKRIKCLRQPK
ncbi:MAG: hypothetical protein ACE5LB_13425 [Acidiferrobacterales bacterium]